MSGYRARLGLLAKLDLAELLGHLAQLLALHKQARALRPVLARKPPPARPQVRYELSARRVFFAAQSACSGANEMTS